MDNVNGNMTSYNNPNLESSTVLVPCILDQFHPHLDSEMYMISESTPDCSKV